jgi:hypothetical protein
MADSILLKVGIDQAQIDRSIAGIQEARKEQDGLKEANKQLNTELAKNTKELKANQDALRALSDAGKENTKEFKALTEATKTLEAENTKMSTEVIKNEVSIKRLSDSIGTNQKVLLANQKIQKSSQTSIVAMRESVKRLTDQYVNLTEEQRRSFQGTQLEISIKKQVESLKKLEEGIGNTSRNVGNYPQVMAGAIKANSAFGNSALGLFESFKANPIGLLVTSLFALGAAFSKTQGATDALNKVFKPLGIALEYVVGFVQDLAAKYLPQLTTAFENPKQALMDLVDFIGNNLLNRIKAFAVIWEGIINLDVKKIANGILQFGSGVENVIDKLQAAAGAVADFANGVIDTANQILAMERALEDAESKLLLSQAKLNRMIEERRSLLENEQELNKNRLKAGEEALKLIQQNAALELDVLNKRIALAEKNASLNGIDRKEQFEINKLLAERDTILAESVGRQKDVRNQINSLRKSIDDQARANRERDAKAEIEREQELREKAAQDYIQELEERKKAVEESFAYELDQLEQRFLRGSITEEQYNQELADGRRAFLDVQKAAYDAYLAEIEVSRLLDDQQQLELEKAQADELNAINQEARQIDLENERKANALKIAEARKVADSKIAALNAVLQTTVAVFGAESTAGKFAASFGALLSTYQGAARALKDYAAPYSYIIAAATGIQGLLQVQKINSTPQPTFSAPNVGSGRRTLAEGGAVDIGGNPHSQGGTVFQGSDGTTFEAERGEKLFVVNRQSTGLLNHLEAVNNYGRTNRAALRKSNYLADGGFVARSVSAPVQQAAQAQQINDDLTEAIQSIEIYTRITELDRVSNEVKQAKVISTL